jgi:hypothetical protein
MQLVRRELRWQLQLHRVANLKSEFEFKFVVPRQPPRSTTPPRGRWRQHGPGCGPTWRQSGRLDQPAQCSTSSCCFKSVCPARACARLCDGVMLLCVVLCLATALEGSRPQRLATLLAHVASPTLLCHSQCSLSVLVESRRVHAGVSVKGEGVGVQRSSDLLILSECLARPHSCLLWQCQHFPRAVGAFLWQCSHTRRRKSLRHINPERSTPLRHAGSSQEGQLPRG